MPNTNFQTIHQMGQAINEVVRQATGRDAVQNIDMDHVTVAQNQYYEEVSVSGSMVSFTDRVGNTPLEKCIVQIEPVQDLHGYDRPWAGGAGKNKLKPVKDAGQTSSFAGMTVEFNADGSVNVFGTKDAQDGFKRITFGTAHLGAGSYIVTGQNLADTTDKLTLQVMNGTTQLANMSYSSAQSFSFTLTGEADIDVNIGFRDGCSLTSPVKMYPMIRLASVTVDTYEPYSNICPITGWTGANIHVSPTTDAQDGTTYPITFPAEAGTVYGGTLDVIHGIILVDRIGVTLDGSTDENWVADGNNTPNGKRFYIQGVIHTKPVANNNTITTMKSNMFSPRTANQTWTGTIGISQSTNGMELEVLPGGCTTVEDLRAFLSANNLEIVYEIVTPIEYQITPQEILTLTGSNNIWADTGDIEVQVKLLKELY